MLEILRFVFSDGWHFAGAAVLMVIVGVFLPANIIKIEIHHRDAD